jgi:CheY-like chemotaxis protein/anti-sigma regulatory factor (Ser/Thr protein kinase)
VMKAEPQVFLINDIFETLEASYGPQAEAAGLELRVVPSSAALKSDPRLLARIVGNFLSNAIRYTRSGTVLLGVRRRGGRVRVAVYDTGPGIPEDQRLEIFREFRQGVAANVAGRGAGVGLGLAIVQRLARLLGHALDVRSTEGKGSVFAVDVPLAEEFLPSASEELEDEEILDVSGMVVVVVDDDREIQEGLAMLLEEWGCRAVVAASAEEALTMLDSAKPDIILSDLHLHDHNSGIAAIAAIRQRTGVAAPAFLFTGDTCAPAELGEGADLQVLYKPLDPMRLRMLLGSVVRR